MRHLSFFAFGFAILGLTQTPLFAQAKKDDPRVTSPPLQLAQFAPQGPCLQHLNGQKLVFIADGAGGSTVLADNLSDVAGDLSFPLRMQMVNWCQQDHKTHDFADQRSQLKAACRLAGWTRLIRKDCPAAEIYFAGQDAGARVVLAAAEMLPPRTIDRIILVGAGVSSTYDLRVALMVSRGGIDHFWSTEDDFLERVVEKHGTSEGGKGWAAGRVGFRMPPWCDAQGRELYRNLRQYKWHDELCGQGQHHAWTIKHNIKKCMIPVFMQPQISFAPSAALLPLPPPPPVMQKMPEMKSPEKK